MALRGCGGDSNASGLGSLPQEPAVEWIDENRT